MFVPSSNICDRLSSKVDYVLGDKKYFAFKITITGIPFVVMPLVGGLTEVNQILEKSMIYYGK